MFKPSFLIATHELQAKKSGIKGKITASDQSELGYMAYISNEPLAIILFYHGGGANYLDYTHMAEQLCDQYACTTYLFDIRGHGESDGTRGYTPSKEQVWSDIDTAIRFVKEKYPNVPIYLGGHSSGSGLLLNHSQWQQQEKVEGYLMIAPELGPSVAIQKTTFAEANKFIFMMNRISNGYLFNKSYAVHFNYSREQIEKWGCVPGYTAAMSNAVTPTDPFQALVNFKKPLYIVMAGEDELIDNEKLKTLLLMASKKNPNISFETAPNEKHIMILKNAHSYIGRYLSNLIRT